VLLDLDQTFQVLAVIGAEIICLRTIGPHAEPARTPAAAADQALQTLFGN
jgi:hypothetical protein